MSYQTAALLSYLILLGVIAAPATMLAAEQRAPALTSAAIEINPGSGGPGTVVQVHGTDFRMQAHLFLARLGPPQDITGARFPDLHGPVAMLGSAQGEGEAGTFATTVTVPATWSSGQPIAEADLCIVAGAGGYYTDFKPFAFTPSALPRVGNAGRRGVERSMLLALGSIIMGAWVLHRAKAARERGKQS